ncbi:unnamed protein product [Rhizoctonia solani]|uniref:F-box domain-containing protein n=1 Tax=Rhizoctonia solani TaxID=456999 RepID=A0A8H3HNR7_9AGAM|nr:unnamed protein product [Rhizoctonia solani]
MADLQPTSDSGISGALLPPDILRLVGDSCPKKDTCSLALTCRSLFNLLVPVLWEVLDGPEKILSLIPGAKVHRVNYETIGNGTTISSKIMIYPNTLSKDWTRYWFYARYVKRLTAVRCEYIAGQPRISCSVHGWNTLFQILKGPVLLPNLRVLEFSLVDNTPIGALQLLSWFTLFLSPSLQEISIAHKQDSVPEFPTSPAVLLVTSLAAALPEAKRMDLSSHYNFPTESSLSSFCPSGYRERYSWFTHLPNLTGLSSLSIHDPGFSARPEDGLLILGHLPYLESLSIRCDPDSRTEGTLSFPPDFFPCLRCFALASSIQMFRYIWRLSAMVSKLVTVTLRFIDTAVTHKEFQTDVISALAKHSAGVRHLSLSQPQCSITPGGKPIEIELGFELVSQLPLQSLSMCLAGAEATEGFYFANRRPSFPALHHLKLVDPINLPHLRTIARMFPNLISLEFFYKDSTWEASDESVCELRSFAAQQQIKIDATLYNDDREDARNDLTRILGALWPNASRIKV